MRVSVLKDDPGFGDTLGINIKYVEVLLDGQQMKGVITADEDAGLIDIYAVDEKGRIQVEGNQAKIERRTGTVVIRLVRAADGQWLHPGYQRPGGAGPMRMQDLTPIPLPQCPDCHGTGMIGESVKQPCSCPVGQKLRMREETKFGDVLLPRQ